jgi:hypothetical protein
MFAGVGISRAGPGRAVSVGTSLTQGDACGRRYALYGGMIMCRAGLVLPRLLNVINPVDQGSPRRDSG